MTLTCSDTVIEGTAKTNNGLTNATHHDNVTIDGCIFKNYDYGFYFNPSYARGIHRTIRNSTFNDNNYGLSLANLSGLDFDTIIATGNIHALSIANSTNISFA